MRNPFSCSWYLPEFTCSSAPSKDLLGTMGPSIFAENSEDSRESRQSAGSKMDSSLQMKLMYMMERLDEPLYVGPKGAKQNFLFDVEMTKMDESEKITATETKNEVMRYARGMKREVTTVKIPLPKMIPNLSNIRAACPRKAAFSFFYRPHQNALYELFLLFLQAETADEFISIAAYCRDNDMMNPRLFLYAFTKACLTRKDIKGFKFPSLFEIMPDVFFNTVVVRQAEEISRIPMAARKVLTANGPSMMAQAMGNPDGVMNPDIEPPDEERQYVKLNRSYTGRDFNPENKMAYFREDMGVNSHHHHWHVVYHPKSAQNRRGELFYYMHHNLVARYDAERLSNGLSRVKPLDLTTRPIIEEGYFSKLTAENSSMAYAGRQANTPVVDVDKRPDPDAGMPERNRVSTEVMRKCKDRIFEAIDTGFVIKRTNENDQVKLVQVPLYRDRQSINDPGIDILGNLVESNSFSVNEGFYGTLHVEGHTLMANLHDPEGHFKESYGAVGDLPTAMRDPAFYRWHKFIDEIFEHYKVGFNPYTEEQLRWNSVVVEGISVQITEEGAPAPNILKTHWMQSDIDLGRGLDIRKSLQREGAIWARVTHLNHEKFQYKINVVNNSLNPVRGTFRIFMAPRDNEHGQRLYYAQQRLLFFEMDRFVHTIPPGKQEVTRDSTASSITIPWEQSFKDLELQLEHGNEEKTEVAVCGCGWPQHMLLPRGQPHGMYFDLFVMVTNAEDDVPKGYEPNRNVKCKESLSFCGALDRLYPDTKPMGFPFDRNPQLMEPAVADVMRQPPTTLADYLLKKSNMNAVEVKIIHQTNVFKIRSGGAPKEMPVLPPELATSKKTQRTPVRDGRESPDFFDEDFY